jgi:hypothetical protein
MKVRLIAVVLLCACIPALAQKNDDGTPLSKPVWEIGPWVGGGTGLGKSSDFKFVNAGVRLGRVLTHTIGDSWFRGTFEYAVDLMPLYEVRQDDNYTSGPQHWVYGGAFNPIILKWNWVANKRVTPYFAAEGGVLFTTTEVPAGNTSRVNFLPGGAFGLYLLKGEKHAIDLSGHITHISNASLGHNPGINATMQFRVGFTWFK